MQINAKNTKKHKKQNQKINLELNGTKVEEKEVAKYLGVLIDNKLSWKSHIEQVKTRLSRGNGMISKIRYYVNDQCLLNLYYAFIQSHINYNLLNWTATYPSFIKPINLKVKAAVRLISFKNKYEHTNRLFITKEILPFDDLINYKKGNFLWKISNGFITSPLSNVFKINSYNKHRFNLPNPSNTLDKYKIVYTCVKYWNSIPMHIRKATTLNNFNLKHKKYLLTRLVNSPR